MKFIRTIISLILIYGIPFHSVKGQVNNNEKSDCTKLYNFLKNDNQDYGNSCCVGHKEVTCNNDGYITSFHNVDNLVIPDLASFPYLSKIENLDLNILNLKEIPNSILNLSSLTSLNLSINEIEAIPSEIKNLSKLTELIIGDNKISVLPDELFTLTSLKELNLGGNNIEVISPAIQNLSNLELLYLNHNNIKKLPNEIFSLTHLNKLYLLNNPNLDAKIVRFGDSTVSECEFNTINVLCYEPFTCNRIHFNNRDFTDVNAEKYFKICTRDEINEIKGQNVNNTDATTTNNNNSDQNNKESSSSFLIIGGIILGCVVGILIGILVAFMLIKKRKSKKHHESDFDPNDEFRTGSIKVVINDKNNKNSNIVITSVKNNNNNSNNNNNNDNNSNNDNKSDDSSSDNNNDNINDDNNNIQNNLNQINLNQASLNQTNLNQANLNPGIMINSNSYNSNALPGMVVLINNPQNPGNYVMGSMPIITSNNQSNMGMLKSSLTYDKKKVALLSKSLEERDEPPPEYTEISKDISKSEAKQQFM